MTYPVLTHYLERLSSAGGATSRIWLDADGKAQGRFFNCTMGSAFQPIRELDPSGAGRVHAYEGLARSVSAADQGLSLWKLLDHAASDDESIELDRLCRMLHAINFFRQDTQADLYLNVHDRLLSAVSSNHGHAFQRILAALELPLDRIVLQLPQVTPQQGWLLHYVADNYRRNGFRLAVNAAGPQDALALLKRVRPDVFKLDVRDLADAGARAALPELLQRCRDSEVALVFKRLETPEALAPLLQAGLDAGVTLLGQGFLLDTPRADLRPAVNAGLAGQAAA